MPKDLRAGQEIYWQVLGEGTRRAVAIHCSLAHSGAWKGVAEELRGTLAITAFDLPGHGQSADWDGRGDFVTLTAQIAASFMDGPVDLIGHSVGGVAALQLAFAVPEMVRTLTLIEPVLFAAARGFPEWDEHLAEMAAYQRALETGDRSAAAREFTRVWGTGVEWESLSPRSRSYTEERIHLISAGNPANVDDAGGILQPGALESLSVPVMLIRGENSPSIIWRISEEIAARLPDVGVADVQGAGHMLPITHPSQVAGLIEVNLSRG